MKHINWWATLGLLIVVASAASVCLVLLICWGNWK